MKQKCIWCLGARLSPLGERKTVRLVPVLVLSLTLVCCVTSGELLHLPGLNFLFCKMGRVKMCQLSSVSQHCERHSAEPSLFCLQVHSREVPSKGLAHGQFKLFLCPPR